MRLNKNNTPYAIIIVLSLIILSLTIYIVVSRNDCDYSYEEIEGYYELQNDNNEEDLSTELLLFKDGSFQENTMLETLIGNYIIKDNKIMLYYQLGLGGGYPQPIYSLTESKELTIKSNKNLTNKTNNYVKNDKLKKEKLIKIVFDGEKDNIINTDNYE